MNKLLDDYLCEKYPKIFADRNKSENESCMYWGFPGDGWFQIIDRLCQGIQGHINNPPYVRANTFQNWIGNLWNRTAWNYVLYPLSKKFSRKTMPVWFRRFSYQTRYVPVPVPQVVALQVKEKFGELCFYYAGGNDVTKGMVVLAEYMSGYVCEVCGTTKDVGQTTKGWIKTVCCEHAGKRDTQVKFNYPENIRNILNGVDNNP